ncbi:DUF2188 domain-containing protein [Streptomyces sp. NPDC046374]|uniref:DUF2188 domain-containing protein n=1 Tax=Streptomyces sp. NPDC046374 TaxID=3154917 RepID=UPI0034013B05
MAGEATIAWSNHRSLASTSKDPSLSSARRHAKEHTPAQVVVHTRDGHIRAAYDYGDAPAASPDERGRRAGERAGLLQGSLTRRPLPLRRPRPGPRAEAVKLDCRDPGEAGAHLSPQQDSAHDALQPCSLRHADGDRPCAGRRAGAAGPRPAPLW